MYLRNHFSGDVDGRLLRIGDQDVGNIAKALSPHVAYRWWPPYFLSIRRQCEQGEAPHIIRIP